MTWYKNMEKLLAGAVFTHWSARPGGTEEPISEEEQKRKYYFACTECGQEWEDGPTGDKHWTLTGHTEFIRVRLRY